MAKLSRSEIASRKRDLARQMLQRGKSNADINAVVLKRFGSGIGPDVLADLREELGMSGANRGSRKRTSKALVNVTPETLVRQSNGGSPELRSSLQGVFSQMRREGIQALGIKDDGHVVFTQQHEMLLDVAGV